MFPVIFLVFLLHEKVVKKVVLVDDKPKVMVFQLLETFFF